jgi:hypothetical protein
MSAVLLAFVVPFFEPIFGDEGALNFFDPIEKFVSTNNKIQIMQY